MFSTFHNDEATALRGSHVWTVVVNGVAVWSQIVFFAPKETDQLIENARAA